MSNLLNAREIWAGGPPAAALTVSGYHPCRAHCAACPAWVAPQRHGTIAVSRTAALTDAFDHLADDHACAAAGGWGPCELPRDQHNVAYEPCRAGRLVPA
jgi:hypothetical protein